MQPTQSFVRENVCYVANLSSKLGHNVLQLGEVAACTNLIINREVSVAILPSCC